MLATVGRRWAEFVKTNTVLHEHIYIYIQQEIKQTKVYF